jgi:multiple sugar transport system ATP-binding protein
LPRETVAAGAPVTIGIRPEFVRVHRTGQQGLPARIDRIEFLGSEIILYCRLDAIGEPVVAKLSPAEGVGLAAGMPVRLEFSAGHLFVFAENGRRLPSTPVDAPVRLETAHG